MFKYLYCITIFIKAFFAYLTGILYTSRFSFFLKFSWSALRWVSEVYNQLRCWNLLTTCNAQEMSQVCNSSVTNDINSEEENET